MEEKKCRLCKKEWMPRVEDPVECPRCKRHDWKEVEKEKEVEEAF